MAKIKNRIIGSGEEPLDGILFNPRNWRIHPLNQQNALKGVLEEVGWVQQVIVNKRTGNLIDGHLRCQLAAREGAKTIPVVYVDVSEDEESLVLATLDPIGAMAATDKQKLDELFADINSENENVKKMLDEIAEKERLEFGKKPVEDVEPQIDKAEELRVKWGVESGQLWQLGEHRLICGDCTDKAVVERVMGGEKANLCFTSPPYWVGKSYETQDSIESINDFIHNVVDVMNFAVRKDKSRIVINTSTGFTTSFDKKKKRQVLLLIDKWTNELYEIGWNLRHVRHWLKEGQLASTAPMTDLIDQHCEFIGTYESDEGEDLVFDDWIEENIGLLGVFYNTSGTTRGQERTGKKWALRAYWDDIKGNANDNNHCAAFPLELVERHLALYTQKGELVYEPFSGSGTTIIGCERFGRKCRAVEISPAYVAVAIQRWVDATGGVPELLE